MNTRLRAAVVRAGAATALAVGLVVGAGAGPAFAADGPDVTVVPVSTKIAKGVKKAKAKPFQVELQNSGNAAATDVTVKVDLRKLASAGIGFTRPDGCERAGKAQYTCAVGDIPADKVAVIGVPLFSVGTAVGAQGSFKVTAFVPGDTNPAGNTETVDVTVEDKGYDFTVWAQDIHAGVVADGDEVGEETKTPLAPGATAPLDSAIYNYGSRRVVGLSYTVQLPEHTSVATMPDGCELREDVVGIACEDDEVVLKPGEVLLPKVTVKVDDDAPVGVFTGGKVTADALEPGGDDAERAGDEARMATQAQRKGFTEADGNDNYANFDAYVGAAPTGEPTTPPATPTTPAQPGEGGGDGGGLPVTGPQTAMIAGVGAAILAGGLVLLLALRRRRRFIAE